MTEEARGGIQRTWVTGAAPPHLEKIIWIFRRMAQSKCSYKLYDLNNAEQNGMRVVSVSSER